MNPTDDTDVHARTLPSRAIGAGAALVQDRLIEGHAVTTTAADTLPGTHSDRTI